MSRGAQFYNCEDYLLAIEDLIRTKGYARICELAEIFRVQNASASGMILRLAKKQWVVRRPYRAVTLTDQGRKIARQLRNRRTLLNRFFQKLGLKPSEAVRELHTLEHVLGLKASRAIRHWLQRDASENAAEVASHPPNGKGHSQFRPRSRATKACCAHSISNNTPCFLTQTPSLKKDSNYYVQKHPDSFGK